MLSSKHCSYREQTIKVFIEEKEKEKENEKKKKKKMEQQIVS
jgi:hypothetical protein